MFKPLPQSRLDYYRDHPLKSGLRYKDFGRSLNLLDYTDQELTEMAHGAYRHTQNLLTDDDFFINLNEVTQAVCVINRVSFIRKLSFKEEFAHLLINSDNIRNFYIMDYILVTPQQVSGRTRHGISKFLCKTGTLRYARNCYEPFKIRNTSHTTELFRSGPIPADLYTPIQLSINRFFFSDDNHISDFRVEYPCDPYFKVWPKH